MHRVAVMFLKNYREWTETLGPDREAVIQKVQAKLHHRLWSVFTKVGALPHHFRYDVAIALVNNVGDRQIKRAVEKLAEVSPVEVEYCVGSGATPYQAYKNCGLDNSNRAEDASVAHVDVVNSTALTRDNGPHYVYTQIVTLLEVLNAKCSEVGCMAFYLGGDNVMIYLPNAGSIYQLLDGLDAQLRVGVGVAQKPYAAFVKATAALDRLRVKNAVGVLIE